MVVFAGLADTFGLAVGADLGSLDPLDARGLEPHRGQEVTQRLGEGRLTHEYVPVFRCVRESLGEPVEELDIAEPILGEHRRGHPACALSGPIELELSAGRCRHGELAGVVVNADIHTLPRLAHAVEPGSFKILVVQSRAPLLKCSARA
ncbi:hypothetical protein D3C78_817760 [compost metagenome]